MTTENYGKKAREKMGRWRVNMFTFGEMVIYVKKGSTGMEKERVIGKFIPTMVLTGVL